MEEVFMEQLDQIYWQGYGETFKEDNPDAYGRQLAEFTENYKIPKREMSKALPHGRGKNNLSTKVQNIKNINYGTSDKL